MTAMNKPRTGGDGAGPKVSAEDGTIVAAATDTVSFTRAELDTLLAAVDEATDNWWRSCAMAGIEHLAGLGHPFTAHDVAQLGVPEPDVPARWGAVMNTAARAGIIVPVGVVGSTRPSVHRSLVRQWIGTTPPEGVPA